jgi:DeoR family transcriptional regulator, galactitol utilization operon repressor
MSFLTAREREILRVLSDDSTVAVSELSRRLGVSEVTIRTDLSNLTAKGYMVRRKRGTAVPAFHEHILARQQSMVAEKERIAKAAAGLIHDGDHIMVLAGTTTALIAKHLFGKRDVHIVSNSTLLLPCLRINPAVRLTLVGGEFRPSMEGLVGPRAIAEITNFHVRAAFLGTDGITIEKGVTAHHVEEAEVAKAMASQADQLIVLSDSSKYGKTGFALMLPIGKVSRLITDAGLGDQARKELTEQGVALTIV